MDGKPEDVMEQIKSLINQYFKYLTGIDKLTTNFQSTAKTIKDILQNLTNDINSKFSDNIPLHLFDSIEKEEKFPWTTDQSDTPTPMDISDGPNNYKAIESTKTIELEAVK